jgi:multidrug efflux pump subunit AcrA (membrane-fusion protein)
MVTTRSAVRNEDGQDVVFVVARGRAERRAVTVSGLQNDDATLSAGLAGGEKVVVNPPAELKDKAKVSEK